MLKQREQVVRGNVSSEHVVQLFDAPESLGEAVAGFLRKGLAAGGRLVVVAKASSVAEIAKAMERAGVSLSALIDDDKLTILDAHATLNTILRDDTPDAASFDALIGDLVIRLAADGGWLHIYGELVEILAEEGNFTAAVELEDLWNQLSAVAAFSLLCGYSSAHFAAPNAGGTLRHICERHTRVHQNNADMLGNWLLGAQRAPKTSPPEAAPVSASNT